MSHFSTNKMSAIDIVKGVSEPVIKPAKQKVSLEFLCKRVRILEALVEEIQGYEIEGEPELDIKNWDSLDYLISIGDTGEIAEQALDKIYCDLEFMYEDCDSLKQREEESQEEVEREKLREAVRQHYNSFSHIGGNYY